MLRATALTGGSAAVNQSAAGITLVLPPDQQDKLDTVIKLELDAPAAGEFIDGSPLDVPAPRRAAVGFAAGLPGLPAATAGAGQVRVSGRAPAGTDQLEVQIAATGRRWNSTGKTARSTRS